jgi:hypothetical protein
MYQKKKKKKATIVLVLALEKGPTNYTLRTRMLCVQILPYSDVLLNLMLLTGYIQDSRVSSFYGN